MLVLASVDFFMIIPVLGVEDGDEVFVVVTVVTSLLFDDEVLAPVGLGDVVFDDIVVANVVAVVVSFLFVVEPTLVGVTSVSVQNKIRVKIEMEDKKTLLYCIMRARFSKWLPLDPQWRRQACLILSVLPFSQYLCRII